MLKKRVLAFIFLCLSMAAFAFDMEACKRWEDVIYGPEFVIDWELKNEDWGRQFCNHWDSGDTSGNHQHFLMPPHGARGAYPSFVDLRAGEYYFVIKCVKDGKETYIHVALDGRDRVLAVWRQTELAY